MFLYVADVVFTVLIDIQPDSVCNKLGLKYASVPVSELKDHPDFYEDLLRCECSTDQLHVFLKLFVFKIFPKYRKIT